MTERPSQTERTVRALTSSRLTPLDGLRGVAILLVVLYHYFGSFASWPLGVFDEQPSTFTPFTLITTRIIGLCSLGWSGVDLFFILSGFLVGGIIFEKGQHSNFLRAFWTRRFWRLAPVYSIFLLFYGVQYHFLSDVPLFRPLFADSFPAWVYLTGTHNIAVACYGDWKAQSQASLWSLAVEVQFYLLAPFLLHLGTRRSQPLKLLALIALAPLFRVLIWQFLPLENNPALASYVLFSTRMDTFWLGVLVAWVLREPVWKAQFLRHRPQLKIAVWIGAFCWLAAAWYTRDPFDETMSKWGYSLLALWYTSILALVVTSTSPQTVLNSRVLQYLGLRAYAIYLFHQIVNAELHTLLVDQPTLIRDNASFGISLVSFGLCLLFAEGLWRYIERPCLRLGHKEKYEKVQTPDPRLPLLDGRNF